METVDVTTNDGRGPRFVILPEGVTYASFASAQGPPRPLPNIGSKAVRFCSQCGCDMDKHMLHFHETAHRRTCDICKNKEKWGVIGRQDVSTKDKGLGRFFIACFVVGLIAGIAIAMMGKL